MNSPARHTVQRLRVAAARARMALGVPGMAGLSLLVVAFGVAGPAWRDHRDFRRAFPRSMAQSTVLPPSRSSDPALEPPPIGDVPRILARIERMANEQGLGWPRAEYRLQPPAQDTPATLEVHCNLEGSYLQLRRFVAVALHQMPTLTLKEFSVSRQTPDTPVVDARLTLVVYLSGMPSAGAAPP